MTYVDGFLLAVPKDRLEEYKELARKANQVWMEHGALSYVETAGDDVSEGNHATLFRKNSLDEMTVRRTEKPVDGVKPIKREKIGAGSYEDPAEEKSRKKRSGKTGRPGR